MNEQAIFLREQRELQKMIEGIGWKETFPEVVMKELRSKSPSFEEFQRASKSLCKGLRRLADNKTNLHKIANILDKSRESDASMGRGIEFCLKLAIRVTLADMEQVRKIMDELVNVQMEKKEQIELAEMERKRIDTQKRWDEAAANFSSSNVVLARLRSTNTFTNNSTPQPATGKGGEVVTPGVTKTTAEDAKAKALAAITCLSEIAQGKNQKQESQSNGDFWIAECSSARQTISGALEACMKALSGTDNEQDSRSIMRQLLLCEALVSAFCTSASQQNIEGGGKRRRVDFGVSVQMTSFRALNAM